MDKTITIRHTHEDGTVLSGSRRGDGVWEIVRSLDNGGFTYRPSVGLFIRSSRDRPAPRRRITAARQALEAAGFTVEVDIDDTHRPREVVLADQADRLEDRQEALQAKAGRRQAAGQAARDVVENITRHRPPGQPILVGHHSEARARRDQQRVEDNTRKSIDLFDQAREIARRADAVGAAADFSATPRVTARRVERSEAELRDLDRKLNGHTRRFLGADKRTVVYEEQHGPAEGEWREELLARRAQLVDQLEYDRQVLAQAAAGGSYVAYGPGTVSAGDLVKVSGIWRRVIKPNPKTVSVEDGFGGQRRLRYTDIDDHRAGQVAR